MRAGRRERSVSPMRSSTTPGPQPASGIPRQQLRRRTRPGDRLHLHWRQRSFQLDASAWQLGWQRGEFPGGWVFDQENRLDQRLHVLVYPSGVDASTSGLRFLTEQLRRHRRTIGSRWRRLSAGRRALLALAHLRVGHTYTHRLRRLRRAARGHPRGRRIPTRPTGRGLESASGATRSACRAGSYC